MTTDNFCFYLQNRLIQTSQTGGQWYSDTLVFPDLGNPLQPFMALAGNFGPFLNFGQVELQITLDNL